MSSLETQKSFAKVPSVKTESEDIPFLLSTDYCDFRNTNVRDLAIAITKNSNDEHQAAVELFEWVKNRLTYRVGLFKHTATDTIENQGGSCTNKANVFVALCRSLGIPAGYHVTVVNTKKYFGAFAVERFTKFVSNKSYHVYAGVKLSSNWFRVDPSDDIKLCDGIKHLVHQATPVYFNGHNDAMLQLDPDHILHESQEVIPSIDEILNKKVRISWDAVDVFNIYMDFLRENGAEYTVVDKAVDRFFDWLSNTHSDKYEKFLKLEEELEQYQKSQINNRSPEAVR